MYVHVGKLMSLNAIADVHTHWSNITYLKKQIFFKIKI